MITRLLTSVCTLAFMANFAGAQGIETCQDVADLFNICIVDRSLVPGTDHVVVPMPNQNRVTFSQRFGSTLVERVDLQGRTLEDMATLIFDAYANRTLNFAPIPSADPYVIAAFTSSRQHPATVLEGPRIVSFLNLDGNLIAVVTDFPNILNQADGMLPTDEQLRGHTEVVQSIRPLGTP